MHPFSTPELAMEPLVAAHADAMFALLSDTALYRHLDESPPASAAQLRDRYTRLEARQSPDGHQLWLNWAVRLREGPDPIGHLQATVLPDHRAWVAYVFGSRHGGRGLATQATRALVDHLAERHGVTRCMATVEVANERSIRLLQRLDFHAAGADELRGHELTATERLFVRG